MSGPIDPERLDDLRTRLYRLPSHGFVDLALELLASHDYWETEARRLGAEVDRLRRERDQARHFAETLGTALEVEGKRPGAVRYSWREES